MCRVFKQPMFGMSRNLLLGRINIASWEKAGVLYPVKVIEWCSEVIHLFLGDTLGISCEDLSLNLIDGTSNGGKQELPSNTDVLSERKYWVITEANIYF